MAGNELVGENVYAFGDSIVCGHVYPHSFVGLVAEHEDMALASSPGTVRLLAPIHMPPAGRCSRRSMGASGIEPNFVVLDRGANDAQSIFRDPSYAIGTYAHELATTPNTMKRKLPTAGFTAAPIGSVRGLGHSGAFVRGDLAGCHTWAISIADVFGHTAFDTRNSAQCAK